MDEVETSVDAIRFKTCQSITRHVIGCIGKDDY